MGVQVREATYGADGNHLPSYSRQFISFEWGGKHIEDFNLLVVFDNARLEKTVIQPILHLFLRAETDSYFGNLIFNLSLSISN